MEHKLPKNWVETELNNLINYLEIGNRPKGGANKINQGIPSISAEHFNYGGYFKFNKLKYIPKDFYTKLKKGKIEKGDILIVKDGATTGKSAFIDYKFPFNKAAVNEHTFIVRTNITFINKLFFYFTLTRNFDEFIEKNKGGSTIGGIKKGFVNFLKIPLPPKAEQERIVAKLDKLFKELESVKTRLENIPTLVKNFRQAILTQAVTGKLTEKWRVGKELEDVNKLYKEIIVNKTDLIKSKKIRKEKKLEIIQKEYQYKIPKHWKFIKLGDPCQFINGDRGKNYPNREEYVETGVPFINTGHILPNGKLNELKMNFISPKKYSMLGGGKIKKEDLVYCLRGATLGKTAIISQYEKGAIASSLVIIRPLINLNSSFLYYYLTSLIGRKFIKVFDNGSAQPNLSAESVRNYILGFPPLQEQTEIVKRVEKLFTQADNIEQSYQNLKTQIDQLPQAILAKAFKGELVEQLPTDGNAQELLNQIQALKANLESKPKKKTRKAKATLNIVAEPRAVYKKEKK